MRKPVGGIVAMSFLIRGACIASNSPLSSSSRSPLDLSSTSVLQKYIGKEYLEKKDVNYQEVSQLLKQIRLRNLNRIIIGHLNVNFFAIKLDAIKLIILDNVDIMIFSETKLDASYPTAQLLINGFSKPFRLDRNSAGGGLLIYI